MAKTKVSAQSWKTFFRNHAQRLIGTIRIRRENLPQVRLAKDQHPRLLR